MPCEADAGRAARATSSSTMKRRRTATRPGDDVGGRESTARPQNTERVAKHRLLIRAQVDDTIRHDDVDRSIRDGAPGCSALARAFETMSGVMSTPITRPSPHRARLTQPSPIGQAHRRDLRDARLTGHDAQRVLVRHVHALVVVVVVVVGEAQIGCDPSRQNTRCPSHTNLAARRAWRCSTRSSPDDRPRGLCAVQAINKGCPTLAYRPRRRRSPALRQRRGLRH
ncbi:MAG: hypothetical protein ACI81R_003387 [Bradymonadia bacterium]|jgi:hypothetical protein